MLIVFRSRCRSTFRNSRRIPELSRKSHWSISEFRKSAMQGVQGSAKPLPRSGLVLFPPDIDITNSDATMTYTGDADCDQLYRYITLGASGEPGDYHNISYKSVPSTPPCHHFPPPFPPRRAVHFTFLPFQKKPFLPNVFGYSINGTYARQYQ